MRLIAGIGFVTPWMLAGMALAALPIVSHLLTRRTRRRIVFPTVRLLAESSASQSQLYKLRRLVLLILRCLAIALVAWAFARPLWREADVPAATGGAGAGVVMVLDTSASAGQQSEGVPLVNSMRAVAGRVLNCLQEGADQVNLVYANAEPRAAWPQLTGSFALVHKELDRLAVTADRADLPKALELTGKLLGTHDGQRRVVILSDMQQTNWTDLLAGRAAGLLPEGTAVTVVPIEGGPVVNVGLSAARARPVQPVVGQPVQLLCQVTNHAADAREVRVDVTVDGRPLSARTLRLSAGGVGEVAFGAKLEHEGQHRVVFSVGPDGLGIDNHAHLVVRAVRRVPVAIVGDDDPNQPGSSTYFLLRALAPRGDMGDTLQVRHLPSGDLTYSRIADAEAVLVGYVGPLNERATAALRTYVNQGGGALLLCGEGPVAENLAAVGKSGGEKLELPWVPKARRDLASAGSFLTITAGAWASPLLKDFDVPCREALGRVRFGRVWRTGDLQPGAAALLTYDDGTPALSERRVGAGRLVLANFSPALTASDLGKYGSFVALMHGLVEYLRPTEDWRTRATVGKSFSYTVRLPAVGGETALRLVGPDRRPAEGELATDGAHLRVTLARPRLVGFYQVQRGEQTAAVLAVNVDPRESDLRRQQAAPAAAALQEVGTAAGVHAMFEAGPILRVRGRPLWAWFVVAAMCAVALELLVLSIWKQ
jgi:hypothetical protein